MGIQYCVHEHPFSLIDNGDKNIICHRCQRWSSGLTYVCGKCRLFFHKNCIDGLKQEIQCFLHPCPLLLFTSGKKYCLACEKGILCFGYGCKFGCDFYVHVECALKPMKKYLDKKHSIPHFTHPHPLEHFSRKYFYFRQRVSKNVSVSFKEHAYTEPFPAFLNELEKDICAICTQTMYTSAYGCENCRFFLHKFCMTSSIPGQLTNHLIHPCTLVIRYCELYKCARCGETKRHILAFSCRQCGFFLDVKCAPLSNTESEEAKEIQHLSHPHRLALVQNHQEYEKEPRCVACVRTCLPPAPTFRCSKSSCRDFFLHRSCAVNFPYQPRLYQHPCHPKHPLALTSIPYNDRVPNPTCGACFRGIGIDSSLFAYTCSNEGCDFTLHFDCSKTSPSFVCDGHPHLLTFLEKTPDLPCHVCGVNCSTFVLRCVPCNFNIHLQCLPSAPTTITHKYHPHSLVLTRNSPLEHELNSEEEAYNSDDEFYCDICEQKRYKREPVYYCAECKFIAELKCVVNEVLPLIPRSGLLIQQVDAHDYDDRHNDDDDDSRWKVSPVLYKIEKLETTKKELEKSLELVTRDLQEAKNMHEKLVADARKKKNTRPNLSV